MSQTTTENDLQAVADAIRSNDRFVVAAHENPDGDALGSMLATTLALQSLGKDVVMYLSGAAPTPGEYSFLDLSELHREVPADLAERVLVAVDCANVRRIGPEPDAGRGREGRRQRRSPSRQLRVRRRQPDRPGRIVDGGDRA